MQKQTTDSHGRFDPDAGHWTGAIGLITRGEADCAIGNFGFTLSRSGAVQYGLVPTYPEAFRMVFVSPIWPASFGWMGVFQVFQMDAWMGMQVNVVYCLLDNTLSVFFIGEPFHCHCRDCPHHGLWQPSSTPHQPFSLQRFGLDPHPFLRERIHLSQSGPVLRPIAIHGPLLLAAVRRRTVLRLHVQPQVHAHPAPQGNAAGHAKKAGNQFFIYSPLFS